MDEVGGPGGRGVHSQGAQLVSSAGLSPRILAAYSGLFPFLTPPVNSRLGQIHEEGRQWALGPCGEDRCSKAGSTGEVLSQKGRCGDGATRKMTHSPPCIPFSFPESTREQALTLALINQSASESSGVGNPELRFGWSDELVSDSGGGGGGSWEEHSREGVHCPRAPQAGAAQSSRDTCASGGRGAQRQAEKDTTVPLARHTRAHTHTQPLGSPGGGSTSLSTGVWGRPADAREGGAGQVACSPVTIFSSVSTLL